MCAICKWSHEMIGIGGHLSSIFVWWQRAERLLNQKFDFLVLHWLYALNIHSSSENDRGDAGWSSNIQAICNKFVLRLFKLPADETNTQYVMRRQNSLLQKKREKQRLSVWFRSAPLHYQTAFVRIYRIFSKFTNSQRKTSSKEGKRMTTLAETVSHRGTLIGRPSTPPSLNIVCCCFLILLGSTEEISSSDRISCQLSALQFTDESLR